MLRPLTLIVLLLSTSYAFAHSDDVENYSFGEPATAAEATRTITVMAMSEMRFDPQLITVRQNEVVTFTVTNKDKIKHELDIGSKAFLRAHQKMMIEMPDMQHDDDATSVTLLPGETKSLTWRFNKKTDEPIELACLIAGHYKSGMKISVEWAG